MSDNRLCPHSFRLYPDELTLWGGCSQPKSDWNRIVTGRFDLSSIPARNAILHVHTVWFEGAELHFLNFKAEYQGMVVVVVVVVVWWCMSISFTTISAHLYIRNLIRLNHATKLVCP
eukprot:gene5235-biopygen13049